MKLVFIFIATAAAFLALGIAATLMLSHREARPSQSGCADYFSTCAGSSYFSR